MAPGLVILGYSEAAMYLGRVPRPDVTAVLSIHGRREFGVEAAVAHRLDLSFDDVDVPAPGDDVGLLRAAARQRWAQQNGLVETAPTERDAAAIIEFAKRVRDVDGVLLCHCGAGVSRAPAAAVLCLATWRGPGAEAECVAEVVRLRPSAMPHPGLVRIADGLLGRRGRLVSAVGQAMRSGRS